MFFLGLNFGFGIVYLLVVALEGTKFNILGSIVFWITILVVPYVVKKHSGVTFNKEKLQFLNRNGEEINDRAPHFFLMVVLTGVCIILVGLLFDGLKSSVSHTMAISVIALMPTFIPVLYCILKNFPIATYFKKECWIGDGTAQSYSAEHPKHHSMVKSHHPQPSHFNKTHNSSASGSSNWYTDPNNRMFSGNIYNRK